MSAVKLDDARRVISAAEKKAREIGQPTNIGFRLLGRPAQGLEFPLRSLSYLKGGIQRCHSGVTARYCGRVLEFRWHPIT